MTTLRERAAELADLRDRMGIVVSRDSNEIQRILRLVAGAPVCVIKGTKQAGLSPAEQIENARVILAHKGRRVLIIALEE